MRVFSFFILLALSLNTWGQIEFEGNNNMYYGSSVLVDEEVDAAWDVINASDQTLNLCARRYELQPVLGADGNFCFGLLCIAWSTGYYDASSEIIPLEPGQVDHSFKAKYRHHGNPGHAIYSYCIYDVDNTVEPMCQVVNFLVDVVMSSGDLVTPAAELNVYPNPVENIGTIRYAFNSTPINGKLVVTNTIGERVKEIVLNSREGVVYIGSSDFSSGLYLCHLENEGVISNSQKIIFK